MPRANRHFIPGYIWHITQRCHKQEFLLKLQKDRKNWLSWLFECKKRFKLKVLNFTVTSNHIHLLVKSNRLHDTIPNSMQLLASRTAQMYNDRKNRKGAFWEDRYHATAIDSDEYLVNCMMYIDMNMVRAGVVDHPSQWKDGGYHEVIQPKTQYKIIDHDCLLDHLGLDSQAQLQLQYPIWLENYLHCKNDQDGSKWSKSIAVGRESFALELHEKLGLNTRRKVHEDDIGFCVREMDATYGIEKNQFLWGEVSRN